MCGYSVSTIHKLRDSNEFCRNRGPDFTNTQIINGVEFLHNLLHITGEYLVQPFHSNEVACVFNGEIYNYKDFGDYPSDGACLIDLYKKYGEKFVKRLDGEFSLCLIDFSKEKIIIAVDTFSCKPLWYEFKDKDFCIASYNSQLCGLGFHNGKKLKPNKTLIFGLKDFQIIDSYTNRRFDLRQFKTNYDDWNSAFERSIKKRSINTEYGIFTGLSSGYDSGAIACELNKQGFEFKTYSVINNENIQVLKDRTSFLKNSLLFKIKNKELKSLKSEINLSCENFSYEDNLRKYDIKKDNASFGLAAICKKANQDNRRIYFSGQGADEIFSDYGFNGEKFYDHSEFGGLFPEKLESIFPWHSFFDGTQIMYLNKEEYIAGHYGIETRYPFLDFDVVQEFLWLSQDLKNKDYKSVLSQYLKKNNFPYESSIKRGFHISRKNYKELLIFLFNKYKKAFR